MAVSSEKWFHFFGLFPFPFLDALSFSDLEGFEDFVFFCWEGKTYKIVSCCVYERVNEVSSSLYTVS